MKVLSASTSTYLFLNGLSVTRPIRLSSRLRILPARVDCYTELFLGLGKTDVDVSTISLFLPSVGSQIEVQGDSTEETAILAWNAMWHVVFLSAITDSDVVCNLQSSVPAESLTPTAEVHVTNYQFRGFSTPRHDLTEAEETWIKGHFDFVQQIMDLEPFKNAVHCLATYPWHSHPRAKLAIIWAGIEGLFSIESELAFRMSLYAAKFLAPSDYNEQVVLFKRVKGLYSVRSKAVHGAEMSANCSDIVDESAELLRALIKRCVESHDLPNVSQLVP